MSCYYISNEMKNIVVCTLVNAVNCRLVQLQRAVMCIAKSYDCTGLFWWRDLILLMYVCFNQQFFCNNILIPYRDCTHTHKHTLFCMWSLGLLSVLFGTVVFTFALFMGQLYLEACIVKCCWTVLKNG